MRETDEFIDGLHHALNRYCGINAHKGFLAWLVYDAIICAAGAAMGYMKTKCII